jgi:Protein of unknown function (DUF3562)
MSFRIPPPVAERDEAFEKRMRQAEFEVAREFNTLDPELVSREFARVTDDLLRNARVMDFVPVLVHRHVRENLRLVPTARAAAGP